MNYNIITIIIISGVLLILDLTHNVNQVEAAKSGRTAEKKKALAGEGSRSLGYKKKGKATKGTTQRPVWRPKEDSKAALARQKNLDPNKIPENDTEFIFLWPDDYYDDYKFEHKKNMIQYGTFEARIQNYHQEELKEAMEQIRNYTGDGSTTEIPEDDEIP